MTDKAYSSHGDDVKEKILSSAKELFVLQGYKKTTIRQIVEHSGVLTGSIYYLFKNKEEIFQALILSLIRRSSHLINLYFEEESPAFKYVARFIVELKAVEMNPLVCESYYEGYTSNTIFEKMIEYFTNIAVQIFPENETGYTREDCYLRTLLIKSMMRGYTAHFYFIHRNDLEEYVPVFIRTVLSLFSANSEEIDQVIHMIAERSDVLENIAEKMIKER